MVIWMGLGWDYKCCPRGFVYVSLNRYYVWWGIRGFGGFRGESGEEVTESTLIILIRRDQRATYAESVSLLITPRNVTRFLNI